MKKYLVTYYETYKKTYEIYAESEADAKEELLYQIQNGWVDGPDQCVDSGCNGAYEMESEDE